MNLIGNTDIPMGFGMALAKNIKAMEAFAALSEEEKRVVIDGTQNVSSKAEMQSYVNSLTEK